MKQISRYFAMLMCICMMCAACGAQHEAGVYSTAADVTGEPTTEESTTEAPTTEEPTTEEPTTEEPTTEEPTIEESTIEEPTTEEPTTEAPTEAQPTEPVNLHTEETQVAGDGIVQVFETGKTLLADLDGDGEAEKITVKVDSEKKYYEQMSMQIDEAYWDEDSFNQITGYMENVENEEFYLVDLDTSDQWLEIAFFEYGPSNDPVTTFLRYKDGELVCIGEVPTGPPDVEYIDYRGMIIPGDKTMTGRVRYDVVQTSFVTMKWRLENSTEFSATIEEMIPEYYQFRLRGEGEYQMYLLKDTTFFKEMNGAADDLITLPKDTVVDFSRYYPEGGWLQVIYEQGTKSVWLQMDEDGMLQPLNVHRWGLGEYIAGLSAAD